MAHAGRKKNFFRRLFLQDFDNDEDEYTEHPEPPQYHEHPQYTEYPQYPEHLQRPEQLRYPEYPPTHQHPHGVHGQYQPQHGFPPPQPPMPYDSYTNEPLPFRAEAPVPVSMPAPPSKWIELVLHLETGPYTSKLGDFPFTIGREMLPSGLTLDDKSVSSRHAIVDLQDGVLTIIDTNSRNGVRINKDTIAPGVSTPLDIGDILTIGRTKITVADFGEDTGQTNDRRYTETEQSNQHTVLINRQESSTSMSSPATRMCGKCGSANTDEDNFCGECGASISATVAQPTPKKFCMKCGTKNENMGKFCLNCGNSLLPQPLKRKNKG